MNETELAFWGLEFTVSKAQRYYSKQREFVERLIFITEYGTTVSGTVAFVALLSSFPTVALWLTGAVSFLGTANIIARFGDRAKSHDSLYRKYAELTVEISSADHNDAAALKTMTTRKHEIAVNEKRYLGVIEADAYNEEIVARGVDLLHQRHIRWYQRPLGNIVTIGPDKFDPIGMVKTK